MPEVKIDWISEKELKDMKFWKEEILTHMLESFDLLHDLNKLEAFTALLTEEESEKLYGHPLLKEYDLLP